MERNTLSFLAEWSHRNTRKPLMIRGARQVGKSSLVRLFAEQNGLSLVELNFDADHSVAKLFSSNNPSEICLQLELFTGKPISVERTVLFLDEIQAAPELIGALRYFYERMPELRVIAAGSLLDFVLEDHSFSMPVGRIEFLHLGPMLFDEFLLAQGKEILVKAIRNISLSTVLSDPVHAELMKQFRLYLMIGGMPEVVKTFVETGSLAECDRVKSSIISTYRDDFSKYRGRVDLARLQKIYAALPAATADQIKYSRFAPEDRATDVERTLHLFELARVIYRVSHSASNGVPLAAEENRKFQKLLNLDVGLVAYALGLNLLHFGTDNDTVMVNAGSLCEQFVGQHLLYREPHYTAPELHYWTREKTGSQAEVDFVISKENRVIPVEVKAGTTGRLRSLQLFMTEKSRNFAVRINGSQLSLTDAPIVNSPENRHYRLLSIPFYLITEIDRLIELVDK